MESRRKVSDRKKPATVRELMDRRRGTQRQSSVKSPPRKLQQDSDFKVPSKPKARRRTKKEKLMSAKEIREIKKEKNRSCAQKCRVRKKVRYLYLETDLLPETERKVQSLQIELDNLRKWAKKLDKGIIPEPLKNYRAMCDDQAGLSQANPGAVGNCSSVVKVEAVASEDCQDLPDTTFTTTTTAAAVMVKQEQSFYGVPSVISPDPLGSHSIWSQGSSSTLVAKTESSYTEYIITDSNPQMGEIFEEIPTTAAAAPSPEFKLPPFKEAFRDIRAYYDHDALSGMGTLSYIEMKYVPEGDPQGLHLDSLAIPTPAAAAAATTTTTTSKIEWGWELVQHKV